MQRIAEPTVSAADAYTICSASIQDSIVRSRMAGYLDIVKESADRYREYLAEMTVIEYLTSVIDQISPPDRDQMRKNYTIRMVKQKSAGRAIYDKLRLSTSTCPFCGFGQVKTLDHYLPKSEFPLLSVTPLNLIPCCTDCNRAKRDTVPGRAEEQAIHPYFDDIDQDVWLAAKVTENEPLRIVFYVEPPSSWSAVLSARVKHHFNLFCLATMYEVQAARELASMKYRMDQLAATGGVELVREYCGDRAESCEKAFRNDWRTALYRALAADYPLSPRGIQL